MTGSVLRWGSATPRDAGSARDLLLDAAETSFGERGVDGTTMEEIAKRAGVSRATLYRYFAGREAVVAGVVLRATERYLDRVQPRIAKQPDLGSALLEFVSVTVRAARRDETIGLLFRSDDHHVAAGIGAQTTSLALFEMVTAFLSPVFAAHRSDLRAGLSVDDAAEWVLRTILSVLTVSGPRRRTAGGLERYLRQFLLPAIVEG